MCGSRQVDWALMYILRNNFIPWSRKHNPASLKREAKRHAKNE